MKMDSILAKSWIQTPKEEYDHIFDELLKFLLEGGRVYNCLLCWARSDFG